MKLRTDSNSPAGVSTGAADLESARRVLGIEARAIDELSAALDGRFVEALDILSKVAGRIIVTGMGKSGHVARKIAATLASTGTPAQYVHPGEASHGDLGMITGDDAILALSNSGETRELDDIVAYARRFAIPLVALTREGNSSLAEAADVAIILPASEEACSLGLTPTSSTTMMLALGDALSVTLLDRKGFSSEDFRVFHPQGQLGGKLLKVSDLMHGTAELPLVKTGTKMSDAILVMTNKRFGSVGVSNDEGRLVGIITDGDLRRHMNSDLLIRDVSTVMTPEPKTIRAQALAAEALHLMNTNKITGLFVVEAGRPVGILHIHDCLLAGVA